jgi:hypothetical protein
MDTDLLDRQAAAIHEAAAMAERRLYDGEGRAIYSPQEEMRRRDDIREQRENKLADLVAAAEARVERERNAISKPLAELLIDPLYSLPALEIERAKAFSAFVEADVMNSALGDLPALIAPVATVGKRTDAVIWRRHVLARLEAERRAAYSEGGQPPNLREMFQAQEALRALEAVIWDKDAIAKRDALLEKRDAIDVYLEHARRVGKSDSELKSEASLYGVDPKHYVAAARNGGGQ